MHPDSTFELRIEFVGQENRSTAELKDSVKDFLCKLGEPSYVEGVVDGLDLDFDYGEMERDYYNELGGAVSPLSIYKYDQSRISELNSDLKKAYGEDLKLQVVESNTSVWMEGWKESFQPFSTESFYVYPPWLQSLDNSDLLPVVIEPGMAFGTGQHATTQLCLREIEFLYKKNPIKNALDVGTGTGILSIGLGKLGCKDIVATDIDSDAVIATKENAVMNKVLFPVTQESVPLRGQYDLVVANILFVVIRKILGELCERLSPEGTLLLSGVLSEEAEELDELARACGLEAISKREMDGWVALTLRKSCEA